MGLNFWTNNLYFLTTLFHFQHNYDTLMELGMICVQLAVPQFGYPFGRDFFFTHPHEIRKCGYCIPIQVRKLAPLWPPAVCGTSS